eukprot:3611578-Prymnesium_polylepis.1
MSGVGTNTRGEVLRGTLACSMQNIGARCEHKPAVAAHRAAAAVEGKQVSPRPVTWRNARATWSSPRWHGLSQFRVFDPVARTCTLILTLQIIPPTHI